MQRISQIISESQSELLNILKIAVEDEKLSKEQYIRYLSMQYHLVKDVQVQFLEVAANSVFLNYPQLRKFLINFAFEEEPHYLLAKNDLDALGVQPYECPLDVKLWRSYFKNIVLENPFLRIGATCILENISISSDTLIEKIMKNTSFLNEKNTKFLKVHRHKELDHGNQILTVLKSSRLNPEHMKTLEVGAQDGATMFLRMLKWSLLPNQPSI